MSKMIYRGNFLQHSSIDASSISYNNSKSGIEATNMQDALVRTIMQLTYLKRRLERKVIYRENKLMVVSGEDGYSQEITRSDLGVDTYVNLRDYMWIIEPKLGDTSEYYEWDHIVTHVTAFADTLSTRTWRFVERSSNSTGNKIKLSHGQAFLCNILGIKKPNI